jgi:UrcA family protein
MTKDRKILLGTAMAGALGAALLCGTSAASAQSYSNEDSYRASQNETVIVPGARRRYGGIQKRQLLGNVNGEINPTELTLSRRVNYSDLNLSRRDDFRTLQIRVRDTARGICAELTSYDFGMRNDDADRECVSKAITGAMAKVRTRAG